jgi:hypothetical protein
VTDTAITEEQFAAFVRQHRGDYTGKAAGFVAVFVEQIGRDRQQLALLLSRQVPPYELVSNRAVSAPDGCRTLPDAERVAQVVPAGGQCRIGHVVQTDSGWLPYHYKAPYRPIGLSSPQINSVICVFVEHLATMGGAR